MAALQVEIESMQKELGSATLLPAAMLLMTLSRETQDADAIVKRHINLLHRQAYP